MKTAVAPRRVTLFCIFLLTLAASPRLTSAEEKSGIIFDMGGEGPVTPPAKIDPKYSAAGLSEAFQVLCKRLGYRIVRLEIEQTEFPFLVSAVVSGRCDHRELRDALSSTPGYAYGGSATRWSRSETVVALNMMPRSEYPRDLAKAMQQRLGSRLNKITALPPRR